MHGQSLFAKHTKNIDPAIAKEITLAHEKGAYAEAVDMAHANAIAKYKQKDYENAITYGLIEILVLEEQGAVSEDYLQALYNLGRFYYLNNNYEAAIDSHEKVIRINFSDETVGRSFFDIGNCYFALGDYFNAVDHYKIAISHIKSSGNKRLLIRRSLDLSNRYEQINTPESLQDKLAILQEVQALSKTEQLSDGDYYALYNSLASYYHNDETFDFERSKYYQLKFFEKATQKDDSLNIARSYSNLGNLYSEVKNDSAIFFFEKALTFYGEEEDVVRTYNNLGYHYLTKAQWQDALTITKRTLGDNQGLGDSDFLLPAIHEIMKRTDKYSVLRSLNIKATAYIKLFQEHNDQGNLNKAMIYLKYADKVIDLLQIESAAQQSKLFWREQASNLYAKAILTSYYLNNNALAFYFNEKNKALLLTESILKNKVTERIPKVLSERDLSFRKEILLLEEKHETAESQSKTKILTQIVQLKKDYQQFMDSLQVHFPQYNTNQQKKAVVSLEEVQQVLKKDMVVVSYVWDTTDPFLDISFAISITKTAMAIYPIAASTANNEMLEAFGMAISRPLETKTDFNSFVSLSHALYLKLFPSEVLRDLLKKKRLVIIPDGDLHMIPFEALITKADQAHYLIEDSELSYTYSMSFLIHNRQNKRNANSTFIGFSPNSFPYTDLAPLSKTASEVATVVAIIDGDVRAGSEATKASFLSESADYKIVHLATHASSGSDPWVAFSDAKLEANELYTFKTQSDLIVLSACNTSTGIMAHGEGVMSLARGFFYAGANSVVSTLWNVSDQAASFIMKDFYEELAAGNSKSESLRAAKLDYLKTHSLSDASPYYWASFVLIGDTDAVPLDRDFTLGIIVLVVFGSMLFFFLLRRKRNCQ